MAKRRRTRSSDEPQVGLVKRNCLVCEWEGLLIEPPGADMDCPWCHGPTQATAINPHVRGLMSAPGKNPFAAALGRLGGLKGGIARAKRLSSEQRRSIARKAALARWKKKR